MPKYLFTPLDRFNSHAPLQPGSPIKIFIVWMCDQGGCTCGASYWGNKALDRPPRSRKAYHFEIYQGKCIIPAINKEHAINTIIKFMVLNEINKLKKDRDCLVGGAGCKRRDQKIRNVIDGVCRDAESFPALLEREIRNYFNDWKELTQFQGDGGIRYCKTPLLTEITPEEAQHLTSQLIPTIYLPFPDWPYLGATDKFGIVWGHW